MKRLGLNPKQRRFVTEYLKDQNGTQAAIRAGYSKHTAGSQAYDLLKKPEIQEKIQQKILKIEEKVLVTKEFVVGGLKEVADRCMTHVPVMEFDHEAKEMVQKEVWDQSQKKYVGVYEFDSTGANRSLELLGKHLCLFTDKVLVADSLEKLLAESNPPRKE